MKQSIKSELSEFAKAALALDAEFNMFEKLTMELDHLALDSDRGLERSQVLLKELNICRQRFEPMSQAFAKALTDAQTRLASNAASVSTREHDVQARQEQVTVLLQRYQQIANMVQQLTQSVSNIRQNDGSISETDRSSLSDHIPKFDEAIVRLIDESKKLMDDAREANIKDLVRNADSLRQSLQTTRHRFAQLVSH